MNSFDFGLLNGPYGEDPPAEDVQETPTSVSRSGRVRKKNSLLADYESVDSLERGSGSGKRRKSTVPKVPAIPVVPEPDPFDGHDTELLSSSMLNDTLGFDLGKEGPFGRGGDDDLDMYLGMGYDGGLSVVGAEEVIGDNDTTDNSMMSVEDQTMEMTESTSASKLTSQAQSTYFSEKSVEKGKRHGPGNPGSSSGVGEKVKHARKDKGSSRVTAYMLWAKDQRVTLQKQNPGIDLSQMSKKLSDLWAQVPANQKKIWKSRAAKEMKKVLHLNDNIKHSGPRPVQPGEPKKRGRKPKALLAMMQQQQIGHSSGAVQKSSTPAAQVNGHVRPSNKSLSNDKSNKSNGGGSSSSSEVQAPGRTRPANYRSNVSIPAVRRNVFSNSSSNSSSVRTGGQNLTNGVVNGHGSYEDTNGLSENGSTSGGSSPRNYEVEPYEYKVTTTSPLDVAAHFSLLGESLSRMGERLSRNQGGASNDNLTVLLDSMLCALGPLACLTKQVPEMDCIPDRNLLNILDDIAYIMPGL